MIKSLFAVGISITKIAPKNASVASKITAEKTY